MTRYVIAGATSGTGDVLIPYLVDKVGRENVTCLVRASSNTNLLQSYGLRMHACDITEPESYVETLDPADVFINMCSVSHAHKSIEALKAAGVERAYFVSTTAVFSKFQHLSELYNRNEDLIRGSGIVYTILRPSMIYGTMRDHNMHRLVQFLSKYPVVPLFDGGSSIMQPVYVHDLAKGIVSVIDDSRTENREYTLAGLRPISYGQIVDCVLSKLGRKVLKLSLNAAWAAAVAKCLERVPGFPIAFEQVLRLREDKSVDISTSVADLGYSPRAFEDGIELEIEEMRLAGFLDCRCAVM